jgi:hypothetical protein
LLIPLPAFVEADTRLPLANLIHEMLQIEPKKRPRASELRALFEVLISRKWYTFLVESNIPLLSKISQSLAEEEFAMTMYISFLTGI